VDEPIDGNEEPDNVDEPVDEEPAADPRPLWSSILPPPAFLDWAKLQSQLFGDVFSSAAVFKQFAPLQDIQRQQAAAIAKVVVPLHEEWQRKVAETMRLSLPTYDAIGKRLTAAAGLNEAYAMALPKVLLPNIVLPKLPSFTPELIELIKNFREQWRKASPPNWPEDDFERLLDFVKETGWSVVWVPTPEVLASLLEAEDAEQRKEVLVEHGAAIAESCRSVLAEVTTPRLAPFVDATDEAARAYLEGLPRAAQALGSSVVTALIHEELGYKSFNKAKAKTNVDPNDAQLPHIRLFVIVSTVPQALNPFNPVTADESSEFSRHGTAHTVSPKQFRPVNALSALMLAASLVRELHQLLVDSLDELEDEASAPE
jgi:hypothetical protein